MILVVDDDKNIRLSLKLILVRYVTNGMYASVIADYEQQAESIADAAVLDRIKAMAAQFNAATAAVKETENQEVLDLCARHLYEMAADVIMSHLLLQNAAKDQSLFARSLALYLNHAEADVCKHATLISANIKQL